MPRYQVPTDRGTYEVEAPTPPTPDEWMQLIQGGQATVVPEAPQPRAPVIGPTGEQAPLAGGPALEAAGQFLQQRLPSLPARPAPTLPQAGAQIAGGTAGSLAGRAMGGIPGGALGSFVGTAAGGLATNRGLLNSVIDGFENAFFDATFAGTGRAFSKAMVPKVGETGAKTLAAQPTGESARELLTGEPKLEPYARGNIVKRALLKNDQDIKAVVDTMFDDARSGVPELDIREVETLAAGTGITLPKTGAMVRRGTSGTVSDIAGTYPDPSSAFSKVSFDDAMKVRSLLLAEQRFLNSKLAVGGSKIKAAAVGEVEEALEAKMAEAARAAGKEQSWRAANAYFKQEYVKRFYQGFVHDMAEASGEEIVPQLAKANAEEAKTFVAAMTKLNGESVGALETARAGILARWMKESTNQNGALQPQRLLRLYQSVDPEVGRTILGPEVYTAFGEFTRNLYKASNRVTMAVGGMGGAATAAGIASTGVGAGAAVGGLEAANEVNFLARMIVNRPSLMRPLSLAVMSGQEDAARNLSGLRKLRVLTAQAVPQAARALGLGVPDPSALFQSPQQAPGGAQY